MARKLKFADGFTIVELLIAVALTSILFVAVGAAFTASLRNYQVNEEIFKAVNNARQALCRITNQLRTADTIDPTASNNECNFFTATGQDITYEYRSADKKLYLITNSDSQEYLLCQDVTAMSFVKTPTEDGNDVESVQISITVAAGDTEQTLSAPVVIRRNLE
jgi:prepilin-type N-terminal cleavage/methylation domain-containing protein